MSVRNVFGGTFLTLGLAGSVIVAAAMLMSLQLENGRPLLMSLAALGGSAAVALFGVLVLFFRR